MSELVFVKLGGSVITDKLTPESARTDVIDRLASEIAAALQSKPDLQLVLGHGSGSFGHVLARRHGTRAGVRGVEQWRGFVQVAAAAACLNRIVTAALLAAGVPAWSLQPSASARCRGGELVSLEVRPVERALAEGLVPLCYGDVALDDLQGGTIVSTEQILAYLARNLHPVRLILVTGVDGVLEADPRQESRAPVIPEIGRENWEATRAALGGAHGADVTGGMLTKVQETLDLVREISGLEAWILSGERPGLLSQALTEASSAILGTRIRW
jgi:isopentenyl phosphate kinase